MKGEVIEVRYSGKSMYPALREGDILNVEFFEGEQDLSQIKLGDLVLHRDKYEWMVHRNLGHRISADWSYGLWSPKTSGRVLSVRRGPVEFELNPRVARLTALLSDKKQSRIRPVRWFYKSLIFLANYFSVLTYKRR